VQELGIRLGVERVMLLLHSSNIFSHLDATATVSAITAGVKQQTGGPTRPCKHQPVRWMAEERQCKRKMTSRRMSVSCFYAPPGHPWHDASCDTWSSLTGAGASSAAEEAVEEAPLLDIKGFSAAAALAVYWCGPAAMHLAPNS